MRKVSYVVGGYETTSYAEARNFQPTGQLQTKLINIEKKVNISPETLAKRQVYFAKLRAKNKNLDN